MIRSPPRRSPRLQSDSSEVNGNTASSTPDGTSDSIVMFSTTSDTLTAPAIFTANAVPPSSLLAANITATATTSTSFQTKSTTTTSALPQTKSTETIQQSIGKVSSPPLSNDSIAQAENKRLRAEIGNLQNQLLEAMRIINSTMPLKSTAVPSSIESAKSDRDRAINCISSGVSNTQISAAPSTSSSSDIFCLDQPSLPPLLNQLTALPSNQQLSTVSHANAMPTFGNHTQNLSLHTAQSGTVPVISLLANQQSAASFAALSKQTTQQSYMQNSMFATQFPELPPQHNTQTNAQLHNLLPPNNLYHLQNDLPGTQLPQVSPHLSGQTSNPLPFNQRAVQRKIYDLPEFSGAPEDWPMFASAFEYSTATYQYGNFENCMRLQKALKGEAKECVMSLLIYPDNVGAVMQQLKLQYGRPDLLIRCQLQQLREIPQISEHGIEKLIPFAIKIQNVVAFLISANGNQHLSNPTLMEELIQKLPMSKRVEWGQYSASLQQYPTLLDFNRWISNVANILRSIQGVGTTRTTGEPKKKIVLHAKDNFPKQQECVHCRGNHKVHECQKFIAMTVPDRWNEVKKLRLCFSCLNSGHSSRECRRRRDCSIDGCQRKHNKLLHEHKIVNEQKNSAEPVLNCVSSVREQSNLLFRVVPVKLYGHNCAVDTHALLDEGSSVTMIDSALVRQLGLRGRESSLNLSWYGGKSSKEVAQVVDFHISGLNKTRKFALKNVYGVPNLNLPTQSFNIDKSEALKIPLQSYRNVVPKLLIGLDHCHLGLPDEIVSLNDGGPYAANTALGWIVFGQVARGETVSHLCLFAQPEQKLYDLVADYFETENFGVKALPVIESKDDVRARQLLKHSTVKVAERYQSGLLWREDYVVLPDSYSMAFNRLLGIERKMRKNSDFAVAYKSIMADYIKKRYVRKLLPHECTNVSPRTWFLPHFGVFNPNKPGKFRLVFDAAATVEGVSLNSKLLKGPQQNKPLLSVLFNFRVGAVAVCGDIKEMYHQVLVAPQDRCSQRLLWRENESQRPEIYEMLVMTFGAACSPCIAQYVRDTNAIEFRDRYPRAVTSILDHHYVDDFVDSFECISKAIEVSKQVREIHASAAYELCRFTSNSSEVVIALQGSKERHVSFANDSNDLQSVEKILGMYWHPKDDAFKFELKFHRVKAEVIDGRRYPTKRELLSVVMSVFDPMGFLSHFMISAKLLLREVWRHDIRWDEVLPVSLHDMWNNWRKDLKNIVHVYVPRHYFGNLSPCSVELHVFVDASEDAFSAVSYWRWIGPDGSIGVSFIAAKTKCAPLKAMTIPRLELQAAVLGTRLMCTIIKEHCLKISSRTYWSDSTTVISWLNSESRRYKPFVAHRISEILDSTRPIDWRWLPTNDNVADDATRMKNAVDFSNATRWFQGPQFLYTAQEEWPDSDFPKRDQPFEEELRPKFTLLVCNNAIIEFNRFSSFLRLKRTMAWVLRIVKRPVECPNSLTATELKEAEVVLCRLAQQESFGSEIAAVHDGKALDKTSDLYSLSPYIDENKLLRVYGRIKAASWLPLESRHPIILPPHHQLSTLIVSHVHKEMKHQNFEATVGEIRKQFWIPRLRKLLRTCVSNCTFCKFRRAVPAPPLMASLPTDRLTPYVRPFSYTGLDYFGPVNVTIGRRHEKRWVALFTCLTVRAIHMEVAYDLSTDSCLLAIRNFISRRGTPSRIRSDNGKNFIGADKVAKQFDEVFDVDRIQDEVSKKGVDWLFNCPLNPSAGGAWERLVQSVKKVLQVTLKEVAPREHVLQSLVIEAENIVNSRPLTHLPVSHEDEEPLTPNHFLIGASNTGPTPCDATIEKPSVLKKQWLISRQLRDHFWKRWIVEYLPELTRRSKWCEYTKPLAVGDLVLICDPDVSRREWKRGRVVSVYKGRDEVIRRADIRTGTGLLKRPVSKLAVLDFEK